MCIEFSAIFTLKKFYKLRRKHQHNRRYTLGTQAPVLGCTPRWSHSLLHDRTLLPGLRRGLFWTRDLRTTVPGSGPSGPLGWAWFQVRLPFRLARTTCHQETPKTLPTGGGGFTVAKAAWHRERRSGRAHYLGARVEENVLRFIERRSMG